MDNLEWILDGIGTELIGTVIGLVIGAFGGGAVGYKIGSKNRIKQKQKARDNAKQIQIGSVNNNGTQQTKPDSRR